MHNCIFTSHCTELVCDKSCPILAETTYLLERNDIYNSPQVFKLTDNEIQLYSSLVMQSKGKIVTYISNNTIDESAKITYVAICNNWQNSQLHCTVYNLRYSQYLDELKRSWTTHAEPDSLEYKRIWSSSAKILIISHFDFVNFGDFESQTLLLLLQERCSNDLTTILVSPKIDALICTKSSVFFTGLKAKLNETVAKVVNKK